MKQTQHASQSRAQDISHRLFEPGWSGRFGAVMLTVVVTAVLIFMSIGIT